MGKLLTVQVGAEALIASSPGQEARDPAALKGRWGCRFTNEAQLSIPGTLGHNFPILQVGN